MMKRGVNWKRRGEANKQVSLFLHFF